jgi:hypothetical protein
MPSTASARDGLLPVLAREALAPMVGHPMTRRMVDSVNLLFDFVNYR